MALFGKMKKKAKLTAERGKVSDLIKEKEREIEKLIYKVGEQYVEKHVDEEDSEYSELFAKILRLRSEKKVHEEELQRLKALNPCPKCGYSNSETAKFCISCGTPLASALANKKKCSKCGAVNEKNSIFCAQCGTAFPKDENKPEEGKPEEEKTEEEKTEENKLEEGKIEENGLEED